MPEQRMKIRTTDGFCIDVEAPVLPAYEVRHMRTVRWFAWCNDCRDWHTHWPGAGYREAHCSAGSRRYVRTGYNLALAGTMSQSQAKAEGGRRRNHLPPT